MPLVQPSSPLHRVHFEPTCVVIPDVPEPSVIHFEKHSIALPSLPSWRRSRQDARVTEAPPPPVITVRVPSLSRKHRRLTSVERPLQPCLRHSHSVSCSNVQESAVGTSLSLPSPPSAFSHKNLMARRTTLPASTTQSILTPVDRVPLRECCPACVDGAMQGLQSDYLEHWTKGAQRRRRASESNAPTSISSGFLAKTVKVDEVDARRGRKHPGAPKCLPPKALNKLCADAEDDESMLFPLPSPRRTPISGTPTLGTPSGTPPKNANSRTPSPRPPPSPNSVARALSATQIRGESRPKLLMTSELTGSQLLAQYPDVDALPLQHDGRRAASESVTGSNRSPSSSPTTSRRIPSLFRTMSPSFSGF